MEDSERDAILAKWGIANPYTSAAGSKALGSRRVLSVDGDRPSNKTLFADGDAETEGVKPTLRAKTILNESLRNAAAMFQEMPGMEEALAFIPRAQPGGDLRQKLEEAIQAKLPTHGAVPNKTIRNAVLNALQALWCSKPPAPVNKVKSIFLSADDPATSELTASQASHILKIARQVSQFITSRKDTTGFDLALCYSLQYQNTSLPGYQAAAQKILAAFDADEAPSNEQIAAKVRSLLAEKP